jgi:hypothetical protein
VVLWHQGLEILDEASVLTVRRRGVGCVALDAVRNPFLAERR